MKILVADDHELIRQGLIFTLRQEIVEPEILEASDAESVLSQLAAHPEIDLVLLDLYMPGADGFGLLNAVCSADAPPPVIIVSGSDEPYIMRKCIDYGASGFIPKSAGKDILMGAIRLVQKGGTYVPIEMLDHRPATRTNSSAEPATPAGAMDDEFSAIRGKVTSRQKQVLELMAVGLSNKEIGRQLDLSENTVKIHVAALLRLLNASNRTEAVVMAQNAGLI